MCSDKVLLCRVVWAPSYKSKKETQVMFAGRMRYPRDKKSAIEVLNFAKEGDHVFGFVENRDQKLNLAKLGGEKAAQSLSGVKVIFCAVDEPTMRLRVVGWYLNATVYSEPQRPARGSIRGDWPFYFKARVSDSFLIAEAARDLLVPTKSKVTEKGFIGQRGVFYPSKSEHYNRFLDAVTLSQNEPGPEFTTPGLEEYQEGQRMAREIMVSARSTKLVRDAKAFHGTKCQACGFDFHSFYGKRGNGFIEVHHKEMLSDRTARGSTVHDVEVLCANCHRMVHKTAVPLSLDELRAIIAAQQSRR